MRILVDAIKTLQNKIKELSDGKEYRIAEPGQVINSSATILQAAWNILETCNAAIKSPFPAIVYLTSKHTLLEHWSLYLFNAFSFEFRVIDNKTYELGQALLPFIDILTADQKLLSLIPSNYSRDILAIIANSKERSIAALRAFEASHAIIKPDTILITKQLEAEKAPPLLEAYTPVEEKLIPMAPSTVAPIFLDALALPMPVDNSSAQAPPPTICSDDPALVSHMQDDCTEVAPPESSIQLQQALESKDIGIKASDPTEAYVQLKNNFFGSDPEKIGGIFGAYLIERANTYVLLDMFERCLSHLFGCFGYKTSASLREKYLSTLHTTMDQMNTFNHKTLSGSITEGLTLFSPRKGNVNLSLKNQLNRLHEGLDMLTKTPSPS